MKQKEYQKLLELVCNKQDSLLAHGLWDSEEYKLMERLKVKLKKKTKKKQILKIWKNRPIRSTAKSMR